MLRLEEVFVNFFDVSIEAIRKFFVLFGITDLIDILIVAYTKAITAYSIHQNILHPLLILFLQILPGHIKYSPVAIGNKTQARIQKVNFKIFFISNGIIVRICRQTLILCNSLLQPYDRRN